ncbi:hypothetical protein L7F22_065048 [Adiantum nelumboides]|nr:hypothetical protein [Adiantum nelumboides]
MDQHPHRRQHLQLEKESSMQVLGAQGSSSNVVAGSAAGSAAGVRIVKIVEPRIVKTDAAHFRSVVHLLTGLPSTPHTSYSLPLSSHMPTATPLHSSSDMRFPNSMTEDYTLQNHENSHKAWQALNAALLTAIGDQSRAEFLERWRLLPPSLLRVIDCKSTMHTREAVLVDWEGQLAMSSYTAVSHTYGMAVYNVFDCECASKCSAKVPRCSRRPCPGHTEDHYTTIGDILKMCAILTEAGAEYVWHDGVCIAQHDDAEVEESIKHMGWIYAHAKETVIFLHYVGSPMAPIRHDRDLVSRWHTRSLQEFNEKLASLCQDDVHHRDRRGGLLEPVVGTSQCVAAIDWLTSLWHGCCQKSTSELSADTPSIDPFLRSNARKWCHCIDEWLATLSLTCFQIPSVPLVLQICSTRESKHEGDRINSILALSGVKDFVAPKDVDVEVSTIEFFKRQGQRGLEIAVFTTNLVWGGKHEWQHTWVPTLSKQLRSLHEYGDDYEGPSARD